MRGLRAIGRSRNRGRTWVSRARCWRSASPIFVGMPPLQYLAKWRMQIAAGLLNSGNTNIATVAAEIGYASEAAFSRAFKKMVGVPPSDWRRRV